MTTYDHPIWPLTSTKTARNLAIFKEHLLPYNDTVGCCCWVNLYTRFSYFGHWGSQMLFSITNNRYRLRKVHLLLSYQISSSSGNLGMMRQKFIIGLRLRNNNYLHLASSTTKVESLSPCIQWSSIVWCYRGIQTSLVTEKYGFLSFSLMVCKLADELCC